VLAAWLAANEKPLTLLTEAAKRARRYDPLVGGERTPLIAILQPAITPYHGPGLVGALTARAMLRLSNAQFDGAWEDLLTCHRLARLVGQGPMLVDYLIGRTVDGRACLGEQAFSGHTCLTAARLRKMREDLDRLPPMPPLAERIDVGERLDFLNIVSDFSRHDRASLLQIASGADLELLGAEKLRRAAEAIANYSADTRVDWGIPLRVGNSWFDRIADAYRKPTGIRRQQALDKIAADFQKLRAMAGDVASLDQAMGVDPTRSLSERLGQVVLIMFWPSTAVEFDLEAAPAMTFELTRLAFALAEYRADHGAYPVKLAELAPRYVRQVPKDIFNDAELRYRRENKGYRLYSVGRNGRDDGGRGVENGRRAEGAEKNDWDDLVIRMPGTDKQ
jgi:hypothetical protein